MNEKIKFVLIGCGKIANGVHIPALKRLVEEDKIEMLGTSDLILQNAKSASLKFEINKYKGFYSNSDKDIKFEIKSLNNPYNSNHNIKFFLDFDKSNNSYKNLWVDHFWQGGTGSLKDYDARYECDKI